MIKTGDKVRLRLGTKYFQDFHNKIWNDPSGVIFTAEVGANYITLVAHGYGVLNGPEGAYGCGSIFAKFEDVIKHEDKPMPIEENYCRCNSPLCAKKHHPRNLEELAKARMIAGKKNHPDQNWDDLTIADLMRESKEELADLYNYFSKSPRYIKTAVYPLLEVIWKFTEPEA